MLFAICHRLSGVWPRRIGPSLAPLSRLWRNRKGQDLIEYALLLMLGALVVIVAVPGAGSNVAIVMSRVGTVLTNAANQGSYTTVQQQDTDESDRDR